MFGHDATNAGVVGDVADQDLLFVHQILAHALICPIVDELLHGHIIRPVIWVWHQDWLLDMIRQVAAFFDLCISVVKCSALR